MYELGINGDVDKGYPDQFLSQFVMSTYQQ